MGRKTRLRPDRIGTTARQSMKIMKFGCASVGDGKRILLVARLIAKYSQKDRIVSVVSAMSGVTDELISVFDAYKKGNTQKGLKQILKLYARHIKSARDVEVLNGGSQLLYSSIKEYFSKLLAYLTFDCAFEDSDFDYCVSFGERLSSLILTSTLSKLGVKTKLIDSALVIVTSCEFRNARVLFTKTAQNAEKLLLPLLMEGYHPVVTGYFGATQEGKVATLGRGGSDYSATVLAHVLDAQEVILWKEVDGIFTYDPKKNGSAQFLSELSYDQALALAQNGAKVLHPEALVPVASKGITVWVRNAFKPEFVGSKIWKGS